MKDMNPSREERTGKLAAFRKACRDAGMIELAPDVYELSGDFPKTLTLSTLVHGNEVGGIEVLLTLLDDISSKKIIPTVCLRLILGNVPAYLEDKRFLESDLNRSFGHPDPKTKEEIRADELKRFLVETDVLIDIHQTTGTTRHPFLIFEFDQQSYNFARFLHQTLPVVTNTKKRDFQGKTSTAYAISNGALAVTIETGQKGVDDTQISLGLELVRKAMKMDFTRPLPESRMSDTYTFFQIISNPDRTLEMVKEFRNFDPVKKDELIAKNHSREVLSEVDGVILFPKYGDYAKASAELALVLKPVKGPEDLP